MWGESGERDVKSEVEAVVSWKDAREEPGCGVWRTGVAALPAFILKIGRLTSTCAGGIIINVNMHI